MAFMTASAQTQELTTEEARSLYKTNVSVSRTSIHDPSVVYDAKQARYYVIGSHRGIAWTKDMRNWSNTQETWGVRNDDGTVRTVSYRDAFGTNHTKTVPKGGKTVTFGNFDAKAWCCAVPTEEGAAWTIDGNMWAPDMVWNPTMGKWCQYLSLNGRAWNSVIVLLTADKLEGPWVYEGPVVYSGFRNANDAAISWKLTDMELVLGTQATLPARYNKGNSWGSFWPNNIDPCVFFDEEGELWIAYGSWSGGIFMLKLNKENGLRDYDVTYSTDYDSKGASLTSDAYFGKRIAGGYYVSGEGPYIEHIGKYYYLFMSYGGFAPDGGYQMRVFRSSNPDGPYQDMRGQKATYDRGETNFGPNTSNRGELVMSAYNNWGNMTVGECAQGHNSIIAAEDGRTYLVYHTKFNDGTIGHQVRVHQVFVNEKGWLCAAPFEYGGEQPTDEDIASKELYTKEEVVGNYKLLVHSYGLNHSKMEEVTPVDIELRETGTVRGSQTGTWRIVDGTSYVTIRLGNTEYYGVLTEQSLEPSTIKALCFTATSAQGVSIWGYKVRDKYMLAQQLNNQTIPVAQNRVLSQGVNLYDIPLLDGVTMEWTSSQPQYITNEGRYNPMGLTEDMPVELTLRQTCGDFFAEQVFNVKAKAEGTLAGDWHTGIAAYYSMDDENLANYYNTDENINLKRERITKRPTIEQDNERNGSFAHIYQGVLGQTSYLEMPNPLKDQTLDEGMSISCWMKTSEEDLNGTVWALTGEGNVGFYITPNAYVAYVDKEGNKLDINNPSQKTTGFITPGVWNFVTMTLSPDAGVVFYVDGKTKSAAAYTYDGTKSDGTPVTRRNQCGDFWPLMLQSAAQAETLQFGRSGLAGSPDICIDDIIVHRRALTAEDASTLSTLAHRVYWFTNDPTGISEVEAEGRTVRSQAIFDLSGRKVSDGSNWTTLPKGIYIVGGKKVVR